MVLYIPLSLSSLGITPKISTLFLKSRPFSSLTLDQLHYNRQESLCLKRRYRESKQSKCNIIKHARGAVVLEIVIKL